MRTIIGITSIMLGIGSADSDNLFIPVALLIFGFFMIRRELKKWEND